MGYEPQAGDLKASQVAVNSQRLTDLTNRVLELERWRGRHVDGALGLLQGEMKNVGDDIKEIKDAVNRLAELPKFPIPAPDMDNALKVTLAIVASLTVILVFVCGLYAQTWMH